MSFVSLFTGAASFTVFFGIAEEAGFLAAHGQDSLDVHGTFDAFLLDLAAQFIRRLDIATVLDIVGMAAAAAEELGPAVAADGLVEDVHVAEERRQFRIGHAVIDIADDVVVLADELMARIDIAVGDDTHVFMTGTAAAQAFGDTGTAVEIHDEMIVNEGTAFIHTLQVEISQAVIFFVNAGQIVVRNGIGQIVTDDRFHGQAFKAEVGHVFYVFGKIEVVFVYVPRT